MPGPNRRVSIEELPDGSMLISSNFEPAGERHEMRARAVEYSAFGAVRSAASLFDEGGPMEGLSARPPAPPLKPQEGDDIPF